MPKSLSVIPTQVLCVINPTGKQSDPMGEIYVISVAWVCLAYTDRVRFHHTDCLVQGCLNGLGNLTKTVQRNSSCL